MNKNNKLRGNQGEADLLALGVLGGGGEVDDVGPVATVVGEHLGDVVYRIK